MNSLNEKIVIAPRHLEPGGPNPGVVSPDKWKRCTYVGNWAKRVEARADTPRGGACPKSAT